jgi:hypothetical protein
VSRVKIDGGCHCGAITYEAEINPENVIICHCTDCQTISGAPYRVNAPVLAERFTLRGTAKTYVKTGDSGRQVTTAFCGDCGAALYSTGDPRIVNLRLGGVRQRAELPPKAQGSYGSAMPWAMDITDIRRIPDHPPAEPGTPAA